MRISADLGQQNNVLNVSRINQRAAQNNASVSPMGNYVERKDTASISSKGKATSLLESLMNQKQQIIENKNKLLDRTLERGGSVQDIKSQMESYDEQLQELDEQISKASAGELTKTDEKEEKLESYKPKTKEEMQTEQLNSIINISSDVKNAEIVASVKTKVEGEINVLKSEIKLTGSTPDKLEELGELKGHASELTAQLGEDLVDIADNINQSAENQTIKPEQENEKADSIPVNKDEISPEELLFEEEAK